MAKANRAGEDLLLDGLEVVLQLFFLSSAAAASKSITPAQTCFPRRCVGVDGFGLLLDQVSQRCVAKLV